MIKKENKKDLLYFLSEVCLFQETIPLYRPKT